MKNKFAYIILLIVTVFINTSAYAGLFGSDEPQETQQQSPFPIDDKTFQEQTKEFHFKPQENPVLEFGVFLPKDWSQKEIEATTNEFPAVDNGNTFSTLQRDMPTDVATFESPFIQGQTLILNVQSVPLYHEVSAKYWLERYLDIHDYLLIGEVKEKNEKEASAAYTYMDNGISKSTKIRALINSNVILLASFSMPSNFEEPLSFLQTKSLDSFTLTNVLSEPIEKRANIDLQGAISISYPKSWNINRQDVEDPRYMVLQLQSLEATGEMEGKKEIKKVNGIIEIAAIRRRESTSLAKEIGNLKSRLEESMHVTFNKMIESKNLKTSPRFTFSRYESYVAEMQDSEKLNKEIHIAVLGDDKWYIISFLYTPLKDADSYNWARNVQSFSSIVKTIK